MKQYPVILAILPVIFLCKLAWSYIRPHERGMTSDQFYSLFWLLFFGGPFIIAILPQPAAGDCSGAALLVIVPTSLIAFIRIPAMIRGMHDHATDDQREHVAKTYGGRWR